jgi:hypothetical protein
MQELINHYKNVALSDKDVLQLVDGKANIILYPELYKVKEIDQILDPYGACFLLYESRPHNGHWCSLLKTNDKQGEVLEFFDPYGAGTLPNMIDRYAGFPDSELKYIPTEFRSESNQDIPYLGHLLLNSDYYLSFNQYPFQKFGEHIKSCGRWCALRIIFKNLTLDQFKELFLNNHSDDLVTFLTI